MLKESWCLQVVIRFNQAVTHCYPKSKTDILSELTLWLPPHKLGLVLGRRSGSPLAFITLSYLAKHTTWCRLASPSSACPGGWFYWLQPAYHFPSLFLLLPGKYVNATAFKKTKEKAPAKDTAMLAFHGLGTEKKNTATATEGAPESTFFKALRSQRLLFLKKAIRLECLVQLVQVFFALTLSL